MFMGYSSRIVPTRRIQCRRNGILPQSRSRGIGDIRIEKSFVGFGMVWKNGWNHEASLDDSSKIPCLRYLYIVAPYYLVISYLLYVHLVQAGTSILIPSRNLNSLDFGHPHRSPVPSIPPPESCAIPAAKTRLSKRSCKMNKRPSQRQQRTPLQ